MNNQNPLLAQDLKLNHGILETVFTPEPVILDLMASWGSHLPAGFQPSRCVGLASTSKS